MWLFFRRKQLERKFLWALLHEPPIVPKNNAPLVPDDDFSSIEDELFFSDFRQFADVMNLCLKDTPWRIQEMPDTHLALSTLEGPAFGRRYDLFHRQVDIGTLEIAPDLNYTTSAPSVLASVQLDWVRLLSFASINELLYCIAAHVCETRGTAWADARSKIDRAMIEALWDSQRIPERHLREDYGTLELHLHGLARWYLGRVSARGSQAAASNSSDGTILSAVRPSLPARH
jgi:hypothetical protein